MVGGKISSIYLPTTGFYNRWLNSSSHPFNHVTSHEYACHWDHHRPAHCPRAWQQRDHAWTPGGQPPDTCHWALPPPHYSALCGHYAYGHNISLLANIKILNIQFYIQISVSLSSFKLNKAGRLGDEMMKKMHLIRIISVALQFLLL